MQQYIYLLSLTVSLVGLMSLDYRYRLAWFWDWRKTARYVSIGSVFFLIWDITGIALTVFWTNPAWVSGWYVVTPNLPIEEFVFLIFLNYIALLAWRLSCLRTSS